MILKAIYFQDKSTAREILLETDPRRMKSLGRQIRGFRQETWDQEKISAMKKAVSAKFMLNLEMKEMLRRTGNAILAECSPYDSIWGTGTASTNPDDWTGQNLLGSILMEVRSEFLPK